MKSSGGVRWLRVIAVIALLFMTTGCGDPPTADDIAGRWPDSAGKLSEVTDEAQEHYEDILVDDLDGAASIDLYRLDESGLGPLSVMIVAGEDELSDTEVNQLRCDVLANWGMASHAGQDDYAGNLGMHGNGGTFSVSVEGTAVLVIASLLEADQARVVAEALGGEDEVGTPECEKSDGPRIAG